MKNLNSFEQILRAKMLKNARYTDPFTQNTSKLETSEPAHMAYLMGSVNKFNFHVNNAKYRIKKTASIRKPHVLDDTQVSAFNFLKKYFVDLETNFTKNDLKKAYRLAALKTHPDSGGSSDLFIELKRHYSVLQGLGY